MRVVAVATPAFALPTLDALQGAADVELAALVTNPDRPRGRGLESGAPAAKEWALSAGLAVYQPEKLTREAITGFGAFEAAVDALVVVASAFYIPTWLRELPRLGAVNLHPSLLPALRGPAPVNWAVINGLAETGVTTMLLADEMDAGDILLQRAVAVDARETAGSLAAKLAAAGAELILETLSGLNAGTVTPAPQDHALATHAPKITAETRAVDWARPANELDCLIRGLYPDAPARASYGGDTVQILAAEPAPAERGAEPGTIMAISGEAVVVACGEGALGLERVKPAGGKEMTGRAFATGRHLAVGDRFTNRRVDTP
jgi:methionyl-tRNA formyltransferase